VLFCATLNFNEVKKSKARQKQKCRKRRNDFDAAGKVKKGGRNKRRLKTEKGMIEHQKMIAILKM
jgi:hypothetical protein